MRDLNIPHEDFIRLSRSWAGLKVVILGDLILDEYIYGRTGRVSREAPVVIVEYDSTSFCPGGAANAAANVSAMGGKAAAVGVTGEDRAGRILVEELKGRGVSTGGVISSADRDTVLKTRVMAGDFHSQKQQIVRIDRENKGYLSEEDESRLLSRFSIEIEDAGAVILSDYDQKLLSDRLIDRAARMAEDRKIPVFADSRYRLTEFRGITGATPNEVELAMAAGIEPAEGDCIDEAAMKLIDRMNIESLIVTRGSLGMTLYRPGNDKLSIPVVERKAATDVTGAGDTVVAVVALAAAAGASLETAMMAANAAASVVVMKRGTDVASPEEVQELLKEIERENMRGE